VLEPINTRDIPGFFLNRQDQADAVRQEVGEPNVKIQMDIYHAQIVEGDLSVKLRKYMPHIDHMQIASVPDRHEPDEGEINYRHLFKLIDELGYKGWIGCEYRPRGKTEDGLGWMKALVS
jgi:hydroxypyruvate isomerase